jgi:hypothetical protein
MLNYFLIMRKILEFKATHIDPERFGLNEISQILQNLTAFYFKRS